MRTRSFANNLLNLCALVGGADALFLTVEHYRTDLTELCGPGGCAGVLGSAYGHLGPIPTAFFGFVLYAALAYLAKQRGRALRALSEANAAEATAYATSGAENAEAPSSADSLLEALRQDALRLRADVRRLDTLLWALALAGFGVSWGLQYVALYVVQAFCPFCFFSACIMTAIFALASWDFLAGRALNGETKLLLGVCGFIALMFGLVALPNVWNQYTTVVKNSGRTFDVRMRDLIAPSNGYVTGDPKAPDLIVEFADYQCPACYRASKMMDKIMEEQHGRYRLMFRNLPLNSHRWAHLEAEIAMAAGAQGKFWPMHDILYKNQPEVEKDNFNPALLYQYAQEAGVPNLDRLKSEVERHVYKTQVDADATTALKLGAKQTPTFFIITPKQIRMVGGVTALQAALK